LVAIAVAAPGVASAACAPAGCPADLGMSTPGMPTTLHLGDTGEMTWTVSNAGPADANSVDFRAALTPGGLLVSVTSDRGQCNSNVAAEVLCPLGVITPGQSVTVRAQYSARSVDIQQIHAEAVDTVPDENKTNNALDSTVSVAPPPGGIAKVKPATSPERILKTGGLTLRLTPALAMDYGIDGTVTTPTGPVTLTHVDLRGATAHSTHRVFLGTLPGALAKIRRALRHAKRLRAKITVTGGGTTITKTLFVTA
jgi:uncharacterized repeat protein (TIGR01451 family)